MKYEVQRVTPSRVFGEFSGNYTFLLLNWGIYGMHFVSLLLLWQPIPFNREIAKIANNRARVERAWTYRRFSGRKRIIIFRVCFDDERIVFGYVRRALDGSSQKLIARLRKRFCRFIDECKSIRVWACFRGDYTQNWRYRGTRVNSPVLRLVNECVTIFLWDPIRCNV